MRRTFARDPAEPSLLSWDTDVISLIPRWLAYLKWTFTVYQSIRTAETLLRLPFELGVDSEAFVAKISKTGSLAGSKVASMVPFFRGTQ